MRFKTTLSLSLYMLLQSHTLYADDRQRDTQTTHQSEKAQTFKLDAIITTANKYEQDIADVNANVSVMDSKTLDRQEINQTQDLSKVFAGLNISNNGSDAFPTATLRGLSSPDFYSTTLNLYVDGVPQSPNFLLQAMGDVEQVELLRGPQGTLYGENSQSGLIHIKTRNPMQKSYANISIVGSRLYEDVNAYIGEAVIKDKLWLKGNVRYKHDNGFIQSPTSNAMLNTADTIMSGLLLYWAVSDNLLATLNYNYYYSNSHKSFYLSKTQYNNNFTLPTDAVVDNMGYNFSNGQMTYAPNATSTGSPTAIYNKNPFDKAKVHNASLKLDYYIGNIDSTLSSITAYQLSQTLNSVYPIAKPKSGADNGYFYDNTQLIQELRLNTNYSNGAKSILGAYYKYLVVDNGMRGFENIDKLGFRNDWSARESINTFALFGDVNIPLGKQFDIGIGTRYQFYAAKMDSATPPMASLPAIHNSSYWNHFNPKLSLGFQANDNTRLYISAAQSTKAGGFVKFPFATQDTIPYKPEQIYSAELGSHTRLLDSALQVNTALYFMYIQDRQSYVGSGFYRTLKNIGDAYSTGVDFDISYTGDRISAFMGANIGIARYFNGGDNKGIIQVAGQETPQPYDVSGLILKKSPLVSLVAGLDYNVANFNHHRFYIGGNTSFSTQYYFDDLLHSKDMTQDAFVLLDLNIRYQYKNMEVKLFSQNTTNTRYATYAFSYGMGETYYIPANPFNAGVSLRYSY